MSSNPDSTRGGSGYGDPRTWPLVYIAGPYSKPDPCENTHEAIKVANRLLDVCTPLVPHLTHFWQTMTPKPYEEWLQMDLVYLARCDAVYRFGGESSGADGEVEAARQWGIPVFRGECDLRSWIERTRTEVASTELSRTVKREPK